MLKTILKITVSGILLSVFSISSNAQILQSRSEIIKERGYDYESGVTDSGTKYIYYDEETSTEQSGSYIRRKVFYFASLDDGTEYCQYWKILEPASETNPNVAYFKKRMVEVGKMKWKDYETNVLYTIEVAEGFCVITAWYDTDN